MTTPIAWAERVHRVGDGASITGPRWPAAGQYRASTGEGLVINQTLWVDDSGVVLSFGPVLIDLEEFQEITPQDARDLAQLLISIAQYAEKLESDTPRSR